MKKMKYIFSLFVLLAAVKWSSAQEFKVAAENTKEAKLTLLDFNGELPIEGYSGSEVVITSTSGRFETPGRAKGLKPIYGGVAGHTGIGRFFGKKGHSLTPGVPVPFSPQPRSNIREPR